MSHAYCWHAVNSAALAACGFYGDAVVVVVVTYAVFAFLGGKNRTGDVQTRGQLVGVYSGGRQGEVYCGVVL